LRVNGDDLKQLEIILDKYNLIPGDVVNGEVTLYTDKELKMRSLTLEIEGAERTKIERRRRSGKHSYTAVYHAEAKIFEKIEYLSGHDILPPGEYKYPFNFMVPLDAIPSYSGSSANVEYTVTAKIDVPMWFDKKKVTDFYVYYNPEKIKGSAKQLSFASDNYPITDYENVTPSGLLGGKKPKPSFLVELHSDTYFAGDNIECNLTLKNKSKKRIRKMKILLRAKEYAAAQGYSEDRTVNKYKRKIGIDEIIEGVPSKFQIPIPPQAKTTHSGVISNCRWYLEFQLDIAFAFDIKAKQEFKVFKWIDR